MKKFLKLVLAGITACSLTACSAIGTSADSPVKNTVNSYFVALEAGKLDDAYKYVGEDVQTDFNTLKETEDSLNQMLSQYSVSDSTKKLMTDAFGMIVKTCVRSHKITNTEKVSDTEYKVTVDADILNSDDISAAVQNIDYNSFISSVSAQVMQKYQTDGETAAAEYLMTSMASWLTSNYGSALKDLKPTTRSIVLIVDKQDDSWLITSMQDQE